MALTSILAFPQITTGPGGPPVAPPNPGEAALFIQFAGGAPVAEYVWDPVAGFWSQMPAPGFNYSFVEAFGWRGKHNHTNRPAVAHTMISQPGVFVPTFSTDDPSADPVDFTIKDMLTGADLATGTFPAGMRSADAASVALADAAMVGVSQFTIAAGEQFQFAAVPTGGHAAAPATGETLAVQGWFIF